MENQGSVSRKACIALSWSCNNNCLSRLKKVAVLSGESLHTDLLFPMMETSSFLFVFGWFLINVRAHNLKTICLSSLLKANLMTPEVEVVY